MFAKRIVLSKECRVQSKIPNERVFRGGSKVKKSIKRGVSVDVESMEKKRRRKKCVGGIRQMEE